MKIIPIIFAFLLTTWTSSVCQIRFYAQYAQLPTSESLSQDFKLLSGIKLDPNKEILLGIGLVGRFNPEKLGSDFRYSQTSFSLGFNYYQTRRLYFTIDASLQLINDLIENLTIRPFDLTKESYFNYHIDVSYVILRRLHLSTGFGAVDFSDIVAETGNKVLETKKLELNLTVSAKLYLFQIRL